MLSPLLLDPFKPDLLGCSGELPARPYHRGAVIHRGSVSTFPKKQFNNVLYGFDHLVPIALKLPIAENPGNIDLAVTFSCHCFTEEFDSEKHGLHHRYAHDGEVRAFDLTRYECSLQLPAVVTSMLSGRIYRSQQNYAYVAHITLASVTGPQSYSVYFSMEKDHDSTSPAARIFVRSAYLKPWAAGSNAQWWRFVQLAGEISGAFPPKAKKPKPQKKKAP
jgi:hypothetical protein